MIIYVYMYSYVMLFVHIVSLWAFLFYSKRLLYYLSQLQFTNCRISFAFDENIGTRVRVNLCLLLFASLV